MPNLWPYQICDVCQWVTLSIHLLSHVPGHYLWSMQNTATLPAEDPAMATGNVHKNLVKFGYLLMDRHTSWHINGNNVNNVRRCKLIKTKRKTLCQLPTLETSTPVRAWTDGGIDARRRLTSDVARSSPNSTISSVLDSGADTSAAI